MEHSLYISQVDSFLINILAACSDFCFQGYFSNVTLLTRELIYFSSKQWFSIAGNFDPQRTFGNIKDTFACHSEGGALMASSARRPWRLPHIHAS